VLAAAQKARAAGRKSVYAHHLRVTAGTTWLSRRQRYGQRCFATGGKKDGGAYACAGNQSRRRRCLAQSGTVDIAPALQRPSMERSVRGNPARGPRSVDSRTGCASDVPTLVCADGDRPKVTGAINAKDPWVLARHRLWL